MFDNDLFNTMFGSGSTMTETEQETTTSIPSYNPTTSYNPYASDYEDDDYSVTPNYTEEQNYNTGITSYDDDDEPENEVQTVRAMHTPLIRKDEAEVVSLVKTKSKIRLEPRMKIIASMFAIIVFALVFAIAWNFASLGRLNSMIADKQVTIEELQASINGLQTQYNDIVSDEDRLNDAIKDNNLVASDDTNTFHIDLDDMYEEKVVPKVSSNWFNDLCNFFSNIFS